MSVCKKGAIFTAIVRDLASDGRGILSHPDGLTVFVPGVWQGEECRVRFIGLQNRIGIGEVVEIIQPSLHRVIPRCPHHGFVSGDCGGCPWQFVDYPAQLQAKQNVVNKSFARLDFYEVNPVWPSPQTYAFRNRTQLKTDGTQLGYQSANSHHIAAIQQCPVLTASNQATLQQLLDRLPNDAWRAPPKRGKQRQWTSLNFDDGMTVDDVVVNQRLPFRQSHHQQNTAMRTWLQTQLHAVNAEEPVLELFCGSGNFTEVIASNTRGRIVAVEGDQRAIDLLQAKNLPRVECVVTNLFEATGFDKFCRRYPFKTLVLDPPRDGLKAFDTLLNKAVSIRKIFYISCNVATMSRDIQRLTDRGFTINTVQPLDQNPHTPHVEVLVALSI